MLLAGTKIIAKIILLQIKEHLKSMIDREGVGFRSESSCFDYIKTPSLFIDSEKDFNSADRECICILPPILFLLVTSNILCYIARRTWKCSMDDDIFLKDLD